MLKSRPPNPTQTCRLSDQSALQRSFTGPGLRCKREVGVRSIGLIADTASFRFAHARACFGRFALAANRDKNI